LIAVLICSGSSGQTCIIVLSSGCFCSILAKQMTKSGVALSLSSCCFKCLWFLCTGLKNPRSPMDDRFDIQFVSGEFLDGKGLEYASGSYHVFGNNGTHTLNNSISTGSGASPTVLTALEDASDHLPIVADYRIPESLCVSFSIADLNGDCVVDFLDFAILGNQWLEPPGIPSADIAPEPPDDFVDILDLTVWATEWLDCNLDPQSACWE
jgi:hypothetical protein